MATELTPIQSKLDTIQVEVARVFAAQSLPGLEALISSCELYLEIVEPLQKPSSDSINTGSDIIQFSPQGVERQGSSDPELDASVWRALSTLQFAKELQESEQGA